MAREFLHCREPNALRFVSTRFPLWPAGRQDAPAKVNELLLGRVDAEGTNDIARLFCGCS